MAIIGHRWSTYLVSKNKCIQLWHWRLAHINNTLIVRASRLVNDIALTSQDTKYDLANILIDSNNSKRSDLSDSDNLILQQIQPHKAKTADAIAIVSQTKAMNDSNILDKLCTLCVGSKSIQVVRQNQSLTAISKKLEEVHADL